MSFNKLQARDSISKPSEFQLAVIIMGLIALMGYVDAFWLPKDKLKGDIIEEAVRSSQMIPKLHLESKDLN